MLNVALFEMVRHPLFMATRGIYREPLQGPGFGFWYRAAYGPQAQAMLHSDFERGFAILTWVKDFPQSAKTIASKEKRTGELLK